MGVKMKNKWRCDKEMVKVRETAGLTNFLTSNEGIIWSKLNSDWYEQDH